MIPFLVLVCSIGLALLLTPLVRQGALRLGVVDHPASRKMHHVPVPLLGGAAIVASFFTVLLGVHFLVPEMLGEHADSLPALLAGGLLIAAVGVWDDWKGMKAPMKFAWQLAAASIVVIAGAQTEMFTNPLGGSLHLGWVTPLITILWIAGVTNAVNLIDGLDGLAAGVSSIAALSLCAVASITDESLVAMASLALAGASLGFLPYNLFPARVFLGDTGSMFLGFTLASLGAVGSLKASTTTLLVLPIVVLGIPVFDTVWAILRRTHRKVSPFEPDREHIHHRLVKVGLHHRHVVLVLCFVSSFLGLSAFIMVQLPYQTGFLFAVLLAMGGALGVWTLKCIDEQLERNAETLAEANGNGLKRATGTGNSKQWEGRRVGRSSDPGEVEVLACAIGRFPPGGARIIPSLVTGEMIREALARRLNVYDVGLFMNENQDLIVVMRIQPLGPEGRLLVRGAIERLFLEHAGRFGDGEDFPRFRWLDFTEASLPEEIGIQGQPAIRH